MFYNEWVLWHFFPPLFSDMRITGLLLSFLGSLVQKHLIQLNPNNGFRSIDIHAHSKIRCKGFELFSLRKSFCNLSFLYADLWGGLFPQGVIRFQGIRKLVHGNIAMSLHRDDIFTFELIYLVIFSKHTLSTQHYA